VKKPAPYHYEIQDNGDWIYFVKGKKTDLYEYRRAVALFEHELKKQRAAEREERLSKPRGVFITKNFTSTVFSKQLAISPQAYARKDPACGYGSYKELEVKAKATGQVVNAYSDDRE
jgi:hypothetical protein